MNRTITFVCGHSFHERPRGVGCPICRPAFCAPLTRRTARRVIEGAAALLRANALLVMAQDGSRLTALKIEENAAGEVVLWVEAGCADKGDGKARPCAGAMSDEIEAARNAYLAVLEPLMPPDDPYDPDDVDFDVDLLDTALRAALDAAAAVRNRMAGRGDPIAAWHGDKGRHYLSQNSDGQ